MIPGSANSLLLASAADAAQYQIERSLRFNSADSASLTQASYSGSGTFSAWVKRCKLSAAQTIISGVSFNASDQLNSSTAVFRDPSAWMHVVVSSLGTYVNNTSVASGSAIAPGAIGSGCDLYLADIHFIDGQALDPTSFGYTDSNGIWQPKAYTGTYGTNGFHLDFADNSAASTAGIGKDVSGNSNDWTPNNLSVAAGAGNDSLVDTPTNYGADTGAGGEVRGNYCTWNPLDKASTITLVNGNLDASGTSLDAMCRSTIAMPLSGKWYMEFIPDSAGVDDIIGVATFNASTGSYLGSSASGWGFQPNLSSGTYKYNGSSAVTVAGTAFSSGDTGMLAVDIDNSKIWLGRNGTWYESGNPTTGANAQFTNLPTTLQLHFALTVGRGGSGGMTANFGQRPFAYTAPSGYKALCTTNLPAPAIADGSTAMDVVLDTGANILTAAQGAIGGSADLLWIKDRANANNHQLIDTVRGGTATLQSNTTAAETTYSAPSGSSVAWTWNAGSSTVSNTDGSITSSVRANASAGFSIVTYTGTGTNGATVGHGLGVSPGMVIVKSRSGAYEWPVYHSSLSAGNNLYLHLTNAQNSVSGTVTAGGIGGATSTTFTCTQGIGNINNTNATSATYVAYCFAPVEGYSAFGSYTGNGSADGPFVYTGFRPRWVMVKMSSSSGFGWLIVDSSRNTYNYVANYLYANASDAELSNVSDLFTFTANGFKIGNSQATNTSAATYIYAAFAEHPFQTARAR